MKEYDRDLCSYGGCSGATVGKTQRCGGWFVWRVVHHGVPTTTGTRAAAVFLRLGHYFNENAYLNGWMAAEDVPMRAC